MAWPVSQDYNEAIQAPQSSFSDPELKGGEPVTNALGMPMPRSGNFADVYEFNTPATKSKWAIKCFTRHVPGLRERYTEISAGLVAAKLPFAVEFQYLVQGIRVRGDWFPILKMRWVEGFLLNEFVRDNLDKPALLGNLGLIWCRMAKRLRDANIAHADLQHGNVILVPGSKASSLAVKLIDYDGMFVPALANKKSGEVGHPNYQHPQRLREGTYSAEVDRFPLLVVATALKALSVGGRELWDRHDNGDNLLFREADLKAPERSALFKELGEMKDAQTRTLVESLKAAVEKKLEEAPLVDELLPETKPTQVRPTASPTAIAAVEPEATVEPEALSDFAGIESPAAAPKKRPQPSRWPLWGVLGGAAAVVSLCLLLAGAGVLWAVFGGSKPNDPIAQNKSDGDGPKLAVNKDSDKKLLKDGDNKPSKDGLTKDPEKDRTGGKIEQPITVPPKNGNGAVAEKPWTPTDGFVPLITPDLAAWRANANWRVENGIVTATDAAGMLLETVRDNYKDFHLRFDTRVKKFGSIDFRSPAASANPTFYSLHMAAGPGNVRLTRTVATGPKTSTSEPFGPSADLPVGEWVSVQLVAQGNRFKVLLNGALVIDAVDEKKTSRGGSILLIGSKDACEYRKMDIRELSPTVPDVPIAADKGFVPLFNGKDLTGWKASVKKPVPWRAENGMLIGSAAGLDHLLATRDDYKDFHLRIEARLTGKSGAGSAVAFRWAGDNLHGYKALLDKRNGAGLGRLTTMTAKGQKVTGNLAADAPDDWINLEIIAQGKRVQIIVNGTTTTDFTDSENTYAGGHIGLAAWGNAVVEFRKIEIKELKAESAPPTVVSATFATKENANCQFITEIKNALRLKLAADGGYVAYSIPKIGAFCYRDGPGFATETEVKVAGADSLLEPAASFPDGSCMVLIGHVKKAPALFLWDARTKQITDTIPTGRKAHGVVVAPDMKYLLAYLTQPVKDAEHWVLLWDIENKKEINRWRADGPIVGYGFSADGMKGFFYGRKRLGLTSFATKDAAAASLDFQPPAELHSLSPDFTRMAVLAPMQQSIKLVQLDGQPIAAIDNPAPNALLLLPAFSPDNKYLLVGLDNVADRPSVNGRGALIDAKSGTVVGVTEVLPQIPYGVQLAANGVAALDGQNLKPRLYRFPVAGPLPAVAPDRFTPLFNGRDLAGWGSYGNQNGDWQVIDGVLTGKGPNLKMLATTRDDFTDLHLRIEARINAAGFSSVAFRYPHGPADLAKQALGGYAVRLTGKPDVVSKTGNLIAFEKVGRREIPANLLLAGAGEWFQLDIIAQADTLTTMINGKEVVGFKNPKTDIKKGRIVLEAMSTAHQTLVEFRKIEIKEPKATTPVVAKKGFRVEVPPESKGVWRVEGDELVQDPLKAGSAIYFGDPSWTDYDFTVEAMRTKGDQEFTLFFRRLDNSKYVCTFGAARDSQHVLGTLGAKGNGQLMTAKGKDNPLQTGRWHLARVKVRADHGECYLDGAKIFDFKAEHHAGGMVGLRTGNAPYRFKNIKVTAPDGTVLLEGLPDLAPAAAPAPGGFVALFDGTSIDGWKRSKENGYWQVKDGILTGSGPNACDLYTRKNDFANFHIRAEARINDRGLSGLFFRATPDLSGGMGGNNGYYAWLTNNDPRKNLKFKTGNISIYPDKGSPYNTPPVAGDLAPAGEWFLLEIIAKGNQVKIMVNSKEGRSIYRNDVPFIPRGCFILQGGQTPQTVVEYRKIEIKEFPGK